MNADAYKNFFNSLSSRSWKEHRISDVLFALLNSSDEFKTLFIKLLNSKRRNYLSPQTTFMEILREWLRLAKTDMNKLRFPTGGYLIMTPCEKKPKGSISALVG